MLASRNRTHAIVAVFRHHPLQLMASALGGACLILLAIVAQVIHPALGAFTIPILGCLIWRILKWFAKTYSLTLDGHLICRERLFGASDNVVTLFGQVRTRQSVLGRLLDYGDIEIVQPGESIKLRCIGNFNDLMQFLEGGIPLSPRRPIR